MAAGADRVHEVAQRPLAEAGLGIGREIRGLDASFENAVAFHAGTKLSEGNIVTAGGRVLGVTGWGENLQSALARAYDATKQISFDGMHYRHDIGWRALEAKQ